MSGRVIGDGEVRELHVLMCDARDELAQRRVEDPIRAARRAEILDQLAQRKRSPPTPPQIGRFRIKARLGEGGQAVVYRAHDEALGRDVALKLLRPHCFHDERSRKLLVREARGMARLSHRNVVQVHDTGTHGQQMYIVMALVEGETLSQWLDEQPRSWQEIVSIFEQAGRGLAAAHREELVHRDFKPSNVLIDRETERPLVGDFGLVGDTSRGARKQSVVAGTPPYMSPEQIQSEPVDARSDQFSFCVALYQALYRRHPFQRGNELIYWANVENPTIEPEEDSSVPMQLWSLINRGLAKAPADRWPSMDSLCAALVAALHLNADSGTYTGRHAVRNRADAVRGIERLTVERHRCSLHDRRLAAINLDIDLLARYLREEHHEQRGRRVAGTILEEPLNRGQFGTVWRSRDAETGAARATKVFHPENLGQGIMLHQFLRSARVIQRLNADGGAPAGIIRVHEVSAEGLAFSMDFHEHGDLTTADLGSWDRRRKIEVFLAVCRAVTFAHEHGTVHRDIKPGNIVLDSRGRPVLTDFDTAINAEDTRVTEHELLGTPVFAAPEQLDPEGMAGSQGSTPERCDLYSLGRLLYFLLLERSPGVLREHNPTLENLGAHPPALVQAIRRATQWSPGRRYPCVRELIRDVEHHERGWAIVRAHARDYARALVRHWALVLVVLIMMLSAIGLAWVQASFASLFEALSLDSVELGNKWQDTWKEHSELLESLEATDLRIGALQDKLMRALQARDYEAARRLGEQLEKERNEHPTLNRKWGHLSQKLRALASEQRESCERIARARGEPPECVALPTPEAPPETDEADDSAPDPPIAIAAQRPAQLRPVTATEVAADDTSLPSAKVPVEPARGRKRRAHAKVYASKEDYEWDVREQILRRRVEILEACDLIEVTIAVTISAHGRFLNATSNFGAKYDECLEKQLKKFRYPRFAERPAPVSVKLSRL